MFLNKNKKIIKYIFISSLICIFIFFTYYRKVLPSEMFTVGTECEYLDVEWYQVLDNGTHIPIELPCDIDAKKNELLTITTILPENIYEEAVLAFRTSKQDITILIDNEIRDEYCTQDTRVFGKNSVSVYLFVPLTSEDSGKELTVHFKTNSTYTGVMRDIYYGEMFGIWYKIIQENAFGLFSAFIMLLLSSATIIISVYMRFRTKQKNSLQYLGWSVLLISLWLIFQSPLRQLFFSNISLASTMTHFCLMLVILPITVFCNGVQKDRYNKIYIPIAWCSIINFFVCTILLVTSLYEYGELQYSTITLYALTCITLVITIILDWKKGYLKEYKLIAYGFIVLVLTAIFQVLSSHNTDTVMKGNIICIGFLFLLIMTFISTILEHIKHEIENVSLKQEINEKTLKVETLTYQAMLTLAHAIDAKDTYTQGHSLRVAEYSRMIASRLGKDEQTQTEIYFMGLLHDIGKIGIRDDIINKPGKLTDEEFDIIKSHPTIGYEILTSMTEVSNIQYGARWHHERYDGTGYPDGKSGKDIPEYARIIAIADSYDAMTSKRSYRKPLSQEKVREEIVNGKGTQFDPEFADIMIQIIDEDKNYEFRQQDSY